MPIVDFNVPEPWDSFRLWRYSIPRRIRADIAVSGVRSADPHESILKDWWGVEKFYLGFHRYMLMKENRDLRAKRLPVSLNIQPGDRVLLYGDVYGWTAEALAAALPGVTFLACDPTPLTQARKTQTETAVLTKTMQDQGVAPNVVAMALAHIDDGLPRARRTVIAEDASNNGSRNRIRNELGGAPSHIVSMGKLNFLFDQEALELSGNLRAMNPANPVAHIVNQFSKPAHGEPEPAPPLNWKHLLDGQRARDTTVDHGGGDIRGLDTEPGIAAKAWGGPDGLLSGDVFLPQGTLGAFV